MCALMLNLKAQDKIIWDSVHFPPSLISEGDYKFQGYSDMARDLFIFNLKDYEHQIVSGSLEKAIQDLEYGENFCFTGLSKNADREKFTEYSKPFLLTLPNELVVKTKDLKRFKSYIGMSNVVNLHKLLQNNGFTFGYLEHRSYSKYIDRLLFLNREKKHLIVRQDKDVTKSMPKVLSEGLIDYMIEYPTSFNYIKNEELIEEEFSFFQIYDTNRLLSVHVGCNKNEFGKKIIKQVNTVIDENEELFEAFYRTWLDYDLKRQYAEFKNKMTK